MTLLRNRKFAILIAFVIIILATLLGVRGSLNKLAADAQDMFYSGVYIKDKGYTQPAIDTHLSNRANSALGFASLLEKHPELANEAEALKEARRELIDAKSIWGKCSANENMQRAFIELSDKSRAVKLSQNEIGDIDRYVSTFMGAQTAIAESLYNVKASSYMDNASFLAQLLKPVLFVKAPQLFV